MPNQALAEIVAVEKQIQARLTEERQKAAAWQAEECERLSREVEQKLADAQRECRQIIAVAEAEAEAEVTALVLQAEEYAARLQDLPDERLREQVARHLRRLLPEEQE